MKKTKILVVLLWLTACESSGPVSEIPQNESDAMVEDVVEDVTVDVGRPPYAGLTQWVDALGTGSVAVQNQSGRRRFTLETTATLRSGPSQVAVDDADVAVFSSSPLFDGLHALAMKELGELSVAQIEDGGFNDGQPVACGGCFETGELWKYVWTRDTAYAVDLGAGAVDPARALASLKFKLSARRDGTDLQIVQDTGSGGSYPVSTDRVVWALGARAVLPYLPGPERDAFEAQALEALKNTIETDRRLVFDATDGLYRGEQSFLDWREQSYPAFVAEDTVPIATSKALSTNVLHYEALKLASELAAADGQQDVSQRFGAWAEALARAIRETFWLDDQGVFSTLKTGDFGGSVVRRFDLLGNSLVILAGIATPEQARRVVENYPHLGASAPVQWPQQQLTPIYHNRAEWPFVTAYWLHAAAAVGNGESAHRSVMALLRGAALNVSNMENFEVVSGAPFVEDGDYSGPVVNSRRQLWSVAGFLGMVHRSLFGLNLDAESLHVLPHVTARTYREVFGGTGPVELRGVRVPEGRVHVTLNFPTEFQGDGFFEVDGLTLNGKAVDRKIPRSQLGPENQVEVTFGAVRPAGALRQADAADWREMFQPRTPEITGVTAVEGGIRVDFSRNDESEELEFRVFRDGVDVSGKLADGDVAFVDSTPGLAEKSPCYEVESRFVSSGNYSQRSRPVCFWGPQFQRVMAFSATQFGHVGGQPSQNYGRFHYEGWGDVGHQLTVPGVVVASTGKALFQVVYGNGAGPMNTGITAAVKALKVVDEQTQGVVAEGALVMPHLGDWARWADSNTVAAELVEGRSYRVEIVSDAAYSNMSAFEHFADYTGGLGGRGGEFNRVNIAELKVLLQP